MKQILINLIGVFFILCNLQIHAENNRVNIEYYKKQHNKKENTIHRSPMRLPLEIYYDDMVRQLMIERKSNVNFHMFIYDKNENPLPFSNITNDTLSLPDNYHGKTYIRIEGEDWIGIGIIEI